MIIRDAIEADFEAVTAIYNEVLRNSTAIYRDEPVEIAERVSLWKSRFAQGYPTLVACDAKSAVCEGDPVAGYASFGDFRTGAGYRFTVEHTVHVHSDWRGRGVGAALMGALIPRAAALGKHVMVGGIDAENTGSLTFHERLGFERVAHFREVGFKFGRYLDLILVQRTIG